MNQNDNTERLLDSLSDEYAVFLKNNNLPSLCAMELLAEAEKRQLSRKVVLYLRDFCQRWEAVE